MTKWVDSTISAQYSRAPLSKLLLVDPCVLMGRLCYGGLQSYIWTIAHHIYFPPQILVLGSCRAHAHLARSSTYLHNVLLRVSEFLNGLQVHILRLLPGKTLLSDPFSTLFKILPLGKLCTYPSATKCLHAESRIHCGLLAMLIPTAFVSSTGSMPGGCHCGRSKLWVFHRNSWGASLWQAKGDCLFGHAESSLLLDGFSKCITQSTGFSSTLRTWHTVTWLLSSSVERFVFIRFWHRRHSLSTPLLDCSKPPNTWILLN